MKRKIIVATECPECDNFVESNNILVYRDEVICEHFGKWTVRDSRDVVVLSECDQCHCSWSDCINDEWSVMP